MRSFALFDIYRLLLENVHMRHCVAYVIALILEEQLLMLIGSVDDALGQFTSLVQ